jgi:hypothetical protein
LSSLQNLQRQVESILDSRRRKGKEPLHEESPTPQRNLLESIALDPVEGAMTDLLKDHVFQK